MYRKRQRESPRVYRVAYLNVLPPSCSKAVLECIYHWRRKSWCFPEKSFKYRIAKSGGNPNQNFKYIRSRDAAAIDRQGRVCSESRPAYYLHVNGVYADVLW